MKKKQILCAIVFGSMLAITGCGDDPVENGGEAGSGGSAGSGGMAGSGGAAGSAGSGGGDFCTTLCGSCGGSQAECEQTCDAGVGQLPAELDSCPSQLETLSNCLGANDCDGDVCETQWNDWIACIIASVL